MLARPPLRLLCARPWLRRRPPFYTRYSGRSGDRAFHLSSRGPAAARRSHPRSRRAGVASARPSEVVRRDAVLPSATPPAAGPSPCGRQSARTWTSPASPPSAAPAGPFLPPAPPEAPLPPPTGALAASSPHDLVPAPHPTDGTHVYRRHSNSAAAPAD